MAGSGKYVTGSSFNWKVVAIYVYQSQNMNTMYIDCLNLPLRMLAVAQDGASQSSHKVRKIPLNRYNVSSQKELELEAWSELIKRKNPLPPLKIIAKGEARIISGVCKWLPGYKITVNVPDEGLNNVAYRMVDIHILVTEEPNQ